MDVQTLKAITEMVRCAARAQGVELADIEVTLCRSVEPFPRVNEKARRYPTPCVNEIRLSTGESQWEADF